jgi:ABC-type dipeptide/oligopeptide/nickel transport system ATPase component
MLRDASALRLYRSEVPQIGGLEAMKKFCVQVLTNKQTKIKPKGIVALGVSGCGKSAFCKALISIVGWPMLEFDIGSLL